MARRVPVTGAKSSRCSSTARRKVLKSTKGSVLALVTVGGVFLVIILIFALNFNRFLGSHQEQVTSIQAAALAAGKDLSRIVVEDADLGFVSLSNFPPTGKGTIAGDNYSLPVHGINSLLATVRLDLIIAHRLNDRIMILCAERDYQLAMQARARLLAALQDAIQPGGTGFDNDGNIVSPLNDAIAVYTLNQVRMASTSSLVPGSMRLSLGFVEGALTNTPVPQPTEFAELSPFQQENSCYKSDMNIPFAGKDFVFASLGNEPALVDYRKFKENLPDLPYSIPSIVYCQADQQFNSSDPGVQRTTRIVHAAACAKPACLSDKRPCPGSLTVSLPAGSIPEIDNLYALLTNVQIAKSPSDITQTVLVGDSPPYPLSPIVLPVVKVNRPPFGQLLRMALHDWIRRAGPLINVQSLLDQMKTSWAADSTPHAVRFAIDSAGSVRQSTCPLLSLPVSHKQWNSVSGFAFRTQDAKYFDIIIKDFVSQPGRSKGGVHAGEPFGEDLQTPANGNTAQLANTIIEDPALLGRFPQGPSGGAIRPTYTRNGIAVDIRFRQR